MDTEFQSNKSVGTATAGILKFKQARGLSRNEYQGSFQQTLYKNASSQLRHSSTSYISTTKY